jgi:hypothetical protein
MSYGSTALASTAIAGLSASAGTFFSANENLAQGSHFRTLEYLGDAEFFEVVFQMENLATPPHREIYIYTHNDPAETPILNVSVGEAFYSQSIIGAARFIVVELRLLVDFSNAPIDISIVGREYFQNN